MQTREQGAGCAQRRWALSAEHLTPVKAAGFTTAGWSNVLWALIAAAVSTRPVTPVAVPPGICAVTAAGWFGFTFTSATCRRPSLSRTAEALTAGSVEASLLYQED